VDTTVVHFPTRRVGLSDVVSHEEPFSDQVTRDLESLKLRLTEMRAEDLAETQARQIAREISAIRLHLKRLEADREWIKRVAERATK
jgi:hypothetical protein